MSKVRHTPPKATKSHSSNLTQIQSEPDINNAVTMSDYVNTNRNKRFRPGNSPGSAPALVSLDLEYEQDPVISKCLTEQTVLINRLLADMGEIKSQNYEIKASNIEIRKSNERMEESMSFINKQFEDMKREVEDLRKERLLQKHYIESLEKKILDLQHKSRSSGIEIRNIPQEHTETTSSLIKTVSKICGTVGVSVQESSIRDVYRLPGKPSSSTTPRPIIAEFSSVQTKQTLMTAIRDYNKGKGKDKKLNTASIGLSGDPKPVYIAEQLPASTKRLFYQAREFAKNNRYKFCWISNSNIFIRKMEGDKQVLIHSEKCLLDLEPQNTI
ncbi:hypothetical protein PYW08_012995 [Mythimna loreyi]|uniref:Uncharacterized protein n=1 Tax=Mythimna loreyi TaxID=667449 RepID=A0ACC2PZ24_9NEOP|nr:hypothetical protein PYW08_012995 [Mythimna loreyi]